MAAALGEANLSWGHPAASELAARLADPQTRVVVTGQQPGLFGGSLYALSKAVAAVRWAQALEAAGQPAVAVFWSATEDHDFAECATTTVLAAGAARSFDFGPDPEPLLPVGDRALGPRASEIAAEIALLGGGPGWTQAWSVIGGFYAPEARFGEAFARWLIHALGARAPLVLDAQLPALKAAQKAFLSRLIERRFEIDAAYREAEAALEGAGYPLQVSPQPGASPLFLVESGARRRIEWRGPAHFGLRGQDGAPRPVEELLAIVEREPGRLSPGVLARPALQDAALGTTLQVLGPGELAYMPQVAPVYGQLGIAAPWTTLRPQVLVLEEKHLSWLEELGLTPAELLGDAAELTRRLAARRGEAPTTRLTGLLETELEALREWAVALDPSLLSPWQKTRDQMVRALETFGGKLAAAGARADEKSFQRFEQLRALCLPLGQPQERVLSGSYFLARYGARFADALFEQMALDGGRLGLITLAAGGGI